MERKYIFHRTGKGCLIALVGGFILLGGVICLGIWLQLSKYVVVAFVVIVAILTAHLSVKHDKNKSI